MRKILLTAFLVSSFPLWAQDPVGDRFKKKPMPGPVQVPPVVQPKKDDHQTTPPIAPAPRPPLPPRAPAKMPQPKPNDPNGFQSRLFGGEGDKVCGRLKDKDREVRFSFTRTISATSSRLMLEIEHPDKNASGIYCGAPFYIPPTEKFTVPGDWDDLPNSSKAYYQFRKTDDNSYAFGMRAITPLPKTAPDYEAVTRLSFRPDHWLMSIEVSSHYNRCPPFKIHGTVEFIHCDGAE